MVEASPRPLTSLSQTRATELSACKIGFRLRAIELAGAIPRLFLNRMISKTHATDCGIVTLTATLDRTANVTLDEAFLAEKRG